MATLGKYYAAKIRGATGAGVSRHARCAIPGAAIRHLQKAAEHWRS
jgi:hypothetical protein